MTSYGMTTLDGELHVDAMMRRVVGLVRDDQHPTLVANRLSELTARIRRKYPEVDSQLARDEILRVLDDALLRADDGINGVAGFSHNDYLTQVRSILRWL